MLSADILPSMLSIKATLNIHYFAFIWECFAIRTAFHYTRVMQKVLSLKGFFSFIPGIF